MKMPQNCVWIAAALILVLSPPGIGRAAEPAPPAPDEAFTSHFYNPDSQLEHVMVEVFFEEDPPSPGGVTMQAMVFRHEGKKTIPAGKRVLQLMFNINDDAKTASEKCHTVELKVDKTVIKAQSTRWMTIDGPSVVANFPIGKVDLLAKAKSITGKVCKDPFALKPDATKQFAVLAKDARKPPVLKEGDVDE